MHQPIYILPLKEDNLSIMDKMMCPLFRGSTVINNIVAIICSPPKEDNLSIMNVSAI